MSDSRKAAAEEEQARAAWREALESDSHRLRIHLHRRELAAIYDVAALTQEEFTYLSEAIAKLDNITGFRPEGFWS